MTSASVPLPSTRYSDVKPRSFPVRKVTGLPRTAYRPVVCDPLVV
jgi:hypothetical protein